MKIILISGKAGSGKTEVANIIKDKMNKVVITNLSKYIKMFALEMTTWDGNDNYKPRTFLQHMGDELRAINPNFLTKRMLEDMEIYKKYYDYVVICDIRLKNEIDYLKKHSKYEVICVRVTSSDTKRKLSLEEKEHITEIELDNYNNFDYIISNRFDNNLEYDVIKFLEGVK